MTPRVKPCENCKRNHLKCDGAKPKCSRCEKAGRDCVRQDQAKFRFLHSSSTQTSTYSQDAELRYIDETSKYTGAQESSEPQTVQYVSSDIRSPHELSSHSSNSPMNSHLVRSSVPNREPIYLPLPQREGLELPCQVNLGEAFLLRYFVEELAKWFDICDPHQHFGIVVPQRVRSCQPLFNAVLSASARHFTTLPEYKQKEKILKLGLQQDLIISEAAVLDYHSRCIAHLRFLANEPDAIMDENLLAAAVVLRFYEELDSPFIDIPTDAATRGLQVFIEAQASLALSSSGLRYAAFWVGFRQEFHMAFSQQRPFRIPLDVCDVYLSWDPAPDHVLVNRLLIIAAHAVQYCYGNADQQVHTRYEELVSLRDQWLNRRPLSLFPVYTEQPEPERGLIFPQKWFLNNCYIVAEQSVGLLDILLTAYDPSVARIGPGQRSAMESIDAKLKVTVLDICGIALSNRQEPTALLTACIAIGICGDRFTDQVEQEALMDIVINSVRDNNYWPSNALREKLRKAWGWENGSNI